MKILIVSDTHGQHRNLEKILEKTGSIELLIHLGDTEGGEEEIERKAGCPVHIIRGNNDYFTDLPAEKEFTLEGCRIFLTHGHAYMVSMSDAQLKKEARKRGADIVMYGHTHQPALTFEDDLIILNPGSVTYPRQPGRRPSYMIMNLEEGMAVDVSLEYL